MTDAVRSGRQLRSLHPKQLKIFTMWCWLIADWNCSLSLKLQDGFSIGSQLTVRKLWRLFGFAQSKSGRVAAPYYYQERNFDSSQQIRDQVADETVNLFRANGFRRRSTKVCQPTEPRGPFFGMQAIWYTSITFEIEKPSVVKILLSYWTGPSKIWSKNYSIWLGRKKVFQQDNVWVAKLN